MRLIITIDTEEDNWGQYALDHYSVENVTRIPRLQDLFDRFAVRPTYLITYPIATDPLAIELLGGYAEAGQCEVGMHTHPWNTPPLVEERTSANSFITNLPVEVQYEKLRHLHQTIRSNFGFAPRAHRSGRWGFDDNIARHLIRLGYAVDSSVSPAIDWSECGGPDYSQRDHRPFTYEMTGAGARAGGALLEVPATVAFVQQPDVARNVYWTIRRRVPFADEMLAVLRRLGAINHVCMSPELDSASEMIRLAEAMLRRDEPVVNVFFHSPTLLDGCSPYVRTPADADEFLERIEDFLCFAASAGLESSTLSEVSAADVKAGTVTVLETPKTSAF